MDKQNRANNEDTLSTDDIFARSKSQSDASTQTEIIQRDYIPVSDLKTFQLESIAFPKIFQHSHNIFFLFAGSLVILICSRQLVINENENSLRINGLIGFGFAAFMLVLYGTIYFPNSIIQRPHPGLWRFVISASNVWLLIVTFVNFYSKKDLQDFIQSAIDPQLGPQNFIEKDYAVDCEFFTFGHPEGNFAHFSKGFFDMYFAAHFCGWFFKMLAVRNFWICQFQSILFEIIELTFKIWLVNLTECWWDSVIHDLLLANTGGMLFAWLLIKKFKMKEYTFKEFDIFKSSKRYAQFIILLILQNLVDLSHFFNKYTLKIEESHNILAVRIWIVGFLVIPAFREIFVYVTDSTCKRLGPAAWNLSAILMMEWLLFFRNVDYKDYSAPFTLWTKIFWFVFFGIILIIFFILLIRDIKNSNKKRIENQKKND